jgi:hypothetical protein
VRVITKHVPASEVRVSEARLEEHDPIAVGLQPSERRRVKAQRAAIKVCRGIMYLIEVTKADSGASPRADLAGAWRPRDQVNHSASIFGPKDDGTFTGSVEVEALRIEPSDGRAPDRPGEAQGIGIDALV